MPHQDFSAGNALHVALPTIILQCDSGALKGGLADAVEILHPAVMVIVKITPLAGIALADILAVDGHLQFIRGVKVAPGFVVDDDEAPVLAQDQVDHPDDRWQVIRDQHGKGRFDALHLTILPKMLLMHPGGILQVQQVVIAISSSEDLKGFLPIHRQTLRQALIGGRDHLMQQFALGEIIRQGDGIKMQDILQVITLLAELNRADPAEAQAGDLSRLHRQQELFGVAVRSVNQLLDICESLPVISWGHGRFFQLPLILSCLQRTGNLHAGLTGFLYNKGERMALKTNPHRSPWLEQKHLFPALLLVIILLTFGLLTPWLGFQGDDWQHLWLFYRIQDLDPAFQPARAGLQWWYEMVMPFLAALPWQWFLLTNLLRWAGAYCLYLLAVRLFPAHKREAAWFTLLFTLYPGYTIAYTPVTFWRGYLEAFLLIASFYCMVLWLENTPQRGWYLGIALLAGLGNMISTEYYFLLELLRPLVIWLALRDRKTNSVRWQISFKRWLPFLLLFLAMLAWRVHAIQASGVMDTTLLPAFSYRPVTALLELGQKISRDFFIVTIQAAMRAFQHLFNPTKLNPALYYLVSGLVAILLFLYFRGSAHPNSPGSDQKRQVVLALLGLGLVSFLLSGGPFWIKQLQVVMGMDVRNRYAMTQGLSFAFFGMALLVLMPVRWRTVQLVAFCLLCGLFAGIQVQAASEHRSEWDLHRQIMWQLAWRAPSIQTGTVIILNDPGFVLSGENSLSSELNWNYVAEEHPSNSDYFIYFDESRFLKDFPDFPAAATRRIQHMGGQYVLNSGQLLGLHFTPSTCLRILDPELDSLDGTFRDFSRHYIPYSDPSLIQAGNSVESARLDPGIYREEPAHDWCYYYQKADLARQLGDWQTIVELGERAFSLERGYSDLAELRPFIEGYAHNGQWQEAIHLTEIVLQANPSQTLSVCGLWQRIFSSLPMGAESTQVIQFLTEEVGCSF